MLKKYESETEKYIRLYERYRVLLSILNRKTNYIYNMACGAGLSTVIFVIGQIIFNIQFENRIVAIGVVVGWFVPVLPFIVNRLRFIHIEPQLLKIMNKNCINVDIGQYNEKYSYEDSKHNALKYYYNYVKELNNIAVKKLGSN
jgi:hypothetical protein